MRLGRTARESSLPHSVNALNRLQALRGANSSWLGLRHSFSTAGSCVIGMTPASTERTRKSFTSLSFSSICLYRAMRSPMRVHFSASRPIARLVSRGKSRMMRLVCLRSMRISPLKLRLSQMNTWAPMHSEAGKLLSWEFRMPST